MLFPKSGSVCQYSNIICLIAIQGLVCLQETAAEYQAVLITTRLCPVSNLATVHTFRTVHTCGPGRKNFFKFCIVLV